MPHRFDLEALAEYEEAARYYAAQQSGLELRFIASIEEAIALICDAPERWRVFAGREVRRALARMFPSASFTRLSLTMSSFSPWRTTAVSRATGEAACEIGSN